MSYCSFDMNTSRNSTSRPEQVVVVGSGVAGLFFALRAAGRGAEVTVVSKTALSSGSTRYAQGGIAAALDPGDSTGAHLSDTLVAGAGLCDPLAAAVLCEEGPARVADLIAWGVEFDRRRGALALGREAAHGAARIVHAGGDATGLHVSESLAQAVREHPGIAVRENETALEVLVHHGTAVGLRTRDAEGTEHRFAGSVVLATGGAGHLFAHTTNPATATADGQALAHRAGAALADLEFVQFHPTALAVGTSPLPLVTEAARGEGGILRDLRGRRFMLHIHPDGDLAPRDVVARAIWAQAREDGAPVHLDLTHLGDDFVRGRFPTVAALCASHGVDIARDLIPVTPAAHYAMGGVLTDVSGRSTVPGLFAIGECACTGVHGANRLASNSLLEGLVMAHRAAAALGQADWPEGLVGPVTPVEEGASGPWVRREIQRLMWEGCGLERDASGLAGVALTLRGLPEAGDAETQNLAHIARLTVAAASHRRESRGAHFRLDHRATDPRRAVRIAWTGDTPHALPLTAFPDLAEEAAA
jgi:L-aspartate oxidase